MKEKFRRFMIGRYGTDDLSKFMLIVAVVLWVLNMFSDGRIFYSWGLLILILAYVRMFSRNIQKRYQENQKYLEIKQKVYLEKAIIVHKQLLMHLTILWSLMKKYFFRYLHHLAVEWEDFVRSVVR